MRMSRGVFGWMAFILCTLLLVMVVMQNTEHPAKLTLKQFDKHMKDDNIVRATIQDGKILGELRVVRGVNEKKEFEVTIPAGGDVQMEFYRELQQYCPSAEIEAEIQDTTLMNLLITLIPWILIFAFLWFFIFRQLRGVGGGPGGMLGNFGRSRHRVTTKELTNVTFNDVAGVDEAKEEVTEIIEFLKNPKRFQKLGGRIPRGVLLVGDPGCGKTLLAKAIAGEADVPFFSISGSDFVEMFVGVGASRVRDLFKQAKENSPCIIFLDEIDAVGRRRGAGFGGGGGHDEREQTLNAILVEMDGFDTSDQVIVCAATNRADVLDPALVRPGRFDRQVFVPLPDVKGRFEILKVHAKKIKLGPDIDLQRLAKITPMFSGADLAATINESALLATMINKDFVEMSDLEEARDKVRWGRAKKSRVVDEKERVATAYHEAGHALIQTLLPDADPLHKVSIIPRGPYGGATFAMPEKDRQNFSSKFVLAQLRILCAGRLAEKLVLNDVNTGASADIRQATDTARKMATEWGMSRLGFIYYGEDSSRQSAWIDLPGGHEYSPVTAQKIDEEVQRLLKEAYDETGRMLKEKREQLEVIAQALLKYETLDASEVKSLIAGESLNRPTITDLLDEDHEERQAIPVTYEPSKDAPREPDLGAGPLPQPG